MPTTDSRQLTVEELQLATRNHGMPLETLNFDVTPVGLHYLLVHYDIPVVDRASWRLHVDGAVRQPVELSLEDITGRRAVTRIVTMECAGNGRARLQPRPLSQPWLHEAVGTGQWTGVPLGEILDEAGVDEAAVEVVFTGLDRGVEGGVLQQYQRSLPVSEARRSDVLLAYGLNGQPLPPQHGFPLRLLVPGWYGMTSVKWLTGITAVNEPFTGYQQSVAYRFRQDRDEPGEPVTRMAVRSLVAPPGVPEFFTRRRVLEAGTVTLTGRAWSGTGPITRVEVSTDDGASWADAALQAPPDPCAWTGWTYRWDAAAGDHVVACRATDAAGNRQPDTPQWNLGGYAVNAVHRVPVTVRGLT